MACALQALDTRPSLIKKLNEKMMRLESELVVRPMHGVMRWGGGCGRSGGASAVRCLVLARQLGRDMGHMGHLRHAILAP